MWSEVYIKYQLLKLWKGFANLIEEHLDKTKKQMVPLNYPSVLSTQYEQSSTQKHWLVRTVQSKHPKISSYFRVNIWRVDSFYICMFASCTDTAQLSEIATAVLFKNLPLIVPLILSSFNYVYWNHSVKTHIKGKTERWKSNSFVSQNKFHWTFKQEVKKKTVLNNILLVSLVDSVLRTWQWQSEFCLGEVNILMQFGYV